VIVSKTFDIVLATKNGAPHRLRSDGNPIDTPKATAKGIPKNPIKTYTLFMNLKKQDIITARTCENGTGFFLINISP
jgi:hypothetical protein